MEEQFRCETEQTPGIEQNLRALVDLNLQPSVTYTKP